MVINEEVTNLLEINTTSEGIKTFLLNSDDLLIHNYQLKIESGHYSIVLDIGCGYGEFTIKYAKNHPESFVIGIEIVNEICSTVVKKIIKEKIQNIVVIQMEAHQFISDFIPIECIDQVFLNFPSPYPKKENGLNHRLINRGFIMQLFRILKNGGILHIATDHLGYLNDIESYIKADYRWWVVPWSSNRNSQTSDLLLGTCWEKKIKEEKKTIYYLRLIK